MLGHELELALRSFKRNRVLTLLMVLAIALGIGATMTTLTAYSNDVSYDCVFTEQLRNFAQAGDVVMAISGSGNSPNVLSAIEFANGAGCKTIALTGRDGGKLGSLAQLNIQVPVQHMGRIEDAHLIICHMIAYNFMENGSTPHSSQAN